MKKDPIISMTVKEGIGGSELEAAIVYQNRGSVPEVVGHINREVDAPTRVGDLHENDADDFIEGKGPYKKI